MNGVANSRSSAWNRAPIDRMANLNVEPGTSSFEELVASVENGVYLETNSSWSIDDSRNKFQFSCERGTLIENGELTSVVRNPSYRGVSANFWRSLSGVGNADTFEVMGVANCGKGEPSQVNMGRPRIAAMSFQQYRRVRRRVVTSQGSTEGYVNGVVDRGYSTTHR